MDLSTPPLYILQWKSMARQSIIVAVQHTPVENYEELQQAIPTLLLRYIA